MKFKSQVYTQASGSIGGIVYSHNQGGMYTRARAKPKKFLEGPQAASRTRFIAATGMWNALADEQRRDWQTYAGLTTWLNPLGAAIKLSGRMHFIRSWCTRAWAELQAYEVLNGPTIPGLPDFGQPTVSISAETQKYSLAFDNTKDWANAAGGALILSLSPAFEPVKNVFAGPYKYVGRTLGATPPPTSPWTSAIPYAAAAGQHVFYRIVATTADGRVSAEVIGFCTVAA